MDLTPADVAALLADFFPRSVTDIKVVQLTVPGTTDQVAIVYEAALWATGLECGRVVMSLSTAAARTLRDQLDELLSRLPDA